MAKIKIASGKGWVFNESTQRLEKWVAEKCQFTLGSSMLIVYNFLLKNLVKNLQGFKLLVTFAPCSLMCWILGCHLKHTLVT